MPELRRLFKRGETESAPANGSTGTDEKTGLPVQTTASASGSDTGPAPAVTAAEAEKHVKTFSALHRWDPNLDDEQREAIEAALQRHDAEAEIKIEGGLEENSPYPEVAATIRNTDEDVPVDTFRAWFLGMLFTTIGCGLNCLFSLRNPTIAITSIIAQLLCYPLGVAMARFLPTRVFNTFGYRWTLNPGPFNIKEHVLITVMANVTFGGGVAYSTYTIEALKGFYHIDLGWGFALLFTITTQMLGFGLAGMSRRFLVYPASMIWPATLPSAALFYTLHDHIPSDPAVTGGWSISRYRWFLYVFLGSFFWYFFPGWIWQSLSVFAFVTWARPNDVIVNQLFGGFSGLSLIPITFDWTYVTGFLSSPLIPPWHAIANTMIGLVVFFVIVAIGLQYSNSFYGNYLPISDSGVYDNMQNSYNVSRILTPEMTLDLAKYKAYSPLFLSTTFSLAYALSFAAIISLIVHTAIFSGPEIMYRFKNARDAREDIHMKLMNRYKEVPDRWFYVLFAGMFALALGTVLGYPTLLTWWAFILACLIAAVWFVPIGMVLAITNIGIGLNVFTEFIIGYLLPGRPLAMMCFKTYGYITMTQGQGYVADLKLGHYMKIPPRSLFWGQGIASLWGSIVQVVVLYWAFGNIEGICTKHQANGFSCPSGKVFFNASVIWGLIGPARIFSPGAIYGKLLIWWLIGAVTPVLIFVLARRFPKSPIRYLNAPVIFGGAGQIPPATPLNYISWGIIGWVFNKYLRNKRRGWWATYNYVTSAGLDVGLALSTVFIFFTLGYTGQVPPSWWGNNVVATTLDAAGGSVRTVLNPGETFGPPPGSW